MIVSKTGEGELLIYKENKHGDFINIIIDEDGDIELMKLTKDRRNTTTKTNATIDETIDFWNKEI